MHGFWLRRMFIWHVHYLTFTSGCGWGWWSYRRWGKRNVSAFFLVQISWIFFKRDHGVSHFVRVTQRDNFKVNSGQFPVVFVATKPRSDFHPKLIFSTGCWAISSCVCGDQYSHFKPNHAVSLTITSYFSCLSLTRAYPMKRPKPKLH